MIESKAPSFLGWITWLDKWLRSMGDLESVRLAATVPAPEREECTRLPSGQVIRGHALCWLCGGSLKGYWTAQGETRRHNTTYHRCSRCGLLMVSPYLDDPALGLCPEQHENYVNDVEKYTSSVCVEGFLYLLDKVERHWFKAGRTGRGRLLEVGSAAGYFLSGARREPGR